MPRLVSVTPALASTAISATGNSSITLALKAAQSVAIYLTVSAASSANYEFDFQTSADGTNFVVDDSLTVTANGTCVLVVDRSTHGVGISGRLSWIRTAGTLTVEAHAVIHEA